MTAQPEKILLVTERPLLPLNFRQILDGCGWMTGHAVLRSDALSTGIDPGVAALVVIDSEAGISWETLTSLCCQNPRSRIVVWCNLVTPPVVQAAMQSGIHGLVSARLAAGEAAQILVRVWQGERQFRFGGDLQSGPSHEPSLTPREQQVVALVREGRRNREIAEALHTTEGSVKVYMNRIFSKTGVKTRQELALAGNGISCREIFLGRPAPSSQPAGRFDAAWMLTAASSNSDR